MSPSGMWAENNLENQGTCEHFLVLSPFMSYKTNLLTKIKDPNVRNKIHL
jgi:hypothetical protein